MRYLGSRLVTTVLIVFGAMLLLFTLSSIVPGDPATALLGPQATPELSRQFIREMGLDQPLPIRLWRFFSNMLQGNLGMDRAFAVFMDAYTALDQALIDGPRRERRRPRLHAR